MNELWKVRHWISGLQWLFFIFANIVVIPIAIGSAFNISGDEVANLLQLSFLVTGLACIVQAFFGHKRAIMEGQSGLWWGIILTLVITTQSEGISLQELGGSLAIGIFISAILTIIIGLAGLGDKLSTLFSDSVMGVFMFLFGVQLIQIFLKGMLAIPFGNAPKDTTIDLPISALSIILVILVIIFNIKAPKKIRNYGLLMGIIVGWILYAIFIEVKPIPKGWGISFDIFPLGKPTWNTGIIVTAVLAGLLNTANTFGALKGSEGVFNRTTTAGEYRRSFTITGIFAGISGFFGLVPYAPFVSSIGFLKQTHIKERIPFIIGGGLFILMGAIPPVGHFFSTLPLAIGSAVLFVSYLQLFNSARDFMKKVVTNDLNVYRVAVPIFVGIVIMILPNSYYASFPDFLRPLISNGLLMGIILSLLMENLIPWDKYNDEESK
ncbi:MAG TPA: uracil/xanthine transporter [Candidatus Avamphibacillus intestinigallinarum]|nr:uracil/xanthine transporter [Candidatus Avamphibacillus intestinigallinarum]